MIKWWQRTGSILAKVMARCLMEPSYYNVGLLSLRSYGIHLSLRVYKMIWRYRSLKQDWNYIFKMASTSPRDQRVPFFYRHWQNPFLPVLFAAISLGGVYMSTCSAITHNWSSLTHWGRVTYIYINKLTIIWSGNGLLPGRCQAIIWTNVRLLLIEPLGTNFSEILIEIYTFSFKKMHLKMSSAEFRPFCLGPNGLSHNKGCFYQRNQHKFIYPWVKFLSKCCNNLIALDCETAGEKHTPKDIENQTHPSTWYK